MNTARGPVSRPVLTSVVFLIVVILGIVSLSRLSIDLMPEITYPTISVITSYGNVGPQEMEELVTRPIEEALAAVQGVEEITSTSTEGRSMVRVAFGWGTDLDVAANDIRDRIDRALGRLPEDIERPMIRKFDLSAFPILIAGVSSSMNPLDLRQLVEDQVKYRLERVPGVAAVDIWGGLMREVHVELRSAQLKALGISPDNVLAAMRSENQNIPAGLYEKGDSEVLVRTQGEFSSLEEIENTVVAMRDGVPIQVRDVAEVVDSWEEIRQFVRIDGKPGMRISISKQSGANTVEVAKEVNAEIERINRDLPQINLISLIDTSVYIEQSINNVGTSLLLGGILAIIVLLLFLRNVSSTLIIATAIPISVLATFGLMYFSGFTLNIMTFGGLALGIGMLVDSAIVVLENIYRHREQGETPVKSALDGTSEVSSAILASVLTTIVVFLPVVFMRGISGIMYQQLAYVVSFSLLCSLAVALTLIPMLSSRFLRYSPGGKAPILKRLQRVYDASDRILCLVERRYEVMLAWALGHRKRVVALAALLFVVSAILIRFIGVELIPAADEGEVRINLQMAVGTRLEIIDEATRIVEDVARREVPEMASMMARVGGGGWRSSGGHTSEVRISLVPRRNRRRSSEQIANALRSSLQGIPGLTARTRAGQGLFILRLGSSSSDNVSVEIRGYDLRVAQELASRVDQVVRTVPGITDTRISREEGSPERVIRIDRQKAADLGLTVSRIGETLETSVGGTQASYFREGGKQYRILVRLSEEDRRELDDLMDLTVVNNRGESVILRNVVSTTPKEGPVRLERKDQERIITVSANFTGRDMGSVISDIRDGLKSVPVPKDFAILFGGDYEEQQKAFSELMLGLVLAILLIYLVMAGQFESLKDPFVVLFSIPMAITGIVVVMILTGTVFSMQAFIGCIMLAGIVVNNAIILVDYTNRLRREDGIELVAAIKLAGSRRLRPILMTASTTVLALVPLSLGLGEGGEAQAPLARVVIGGLISSTMITLVLIPVVYSIFEQKIRGPR
ncbi:efflux RND transporter permease subunit [Candidatus Eisenbacteria bacterium]|uniref:Efflux RND transporter permease subunit n=1 Tax=Eiseniibacteriota bacterium TaxID=2212470 RepID=A0ABV6YN83_UNCEI